MCIRDSLEGRDQIEFRTYSKNPLEFLERIEEIIHRNRESRWSIIKGMLDESFKNTFDNWWTATRHEVGSYDTFKTAFKQKYWSEATQNIIRDDITNGKFDVNGRQSMTTYFLGKICLARNLEPAIPEECLVTKLAYHFNQGISQGRLNSQIKTIQGMCDLLESHERERYYQRNRQVPSQAYAVSYTHLDVYKRQT